jgi:hypothetical protein
MHKPSQRIFIAAVIGASVLGMYFFAGSAIATETTGEKIDRIAQQSASGIRHGAAWAGNGLRKGADKAGEGIGKGVAHAADGIKKGVRKTGEAFEKAGNWLQQSAS